MINLLSELHRFKEKQVKIEKIAIITNYNISDKLAAAMEVAEKLSSRVKALFIPETYKERIFRSHSHRSYFTYASLDSIYAKIRGNCLL